MLGNRILVVEDDPTSRMLLAQMLVDMGNTVTSAANADEALQFLYTDESCDLVLSDVVMPGMSGIELARRTHDARPGVPFILITGIPRALDEAVEAGDLVIPKPVTRARLATVIQDALDT